MENSLQVNSASQHSTENSRQYVREVLVVLFFNTLICTLVAVFGWLAIPAIGQHGLLSSLVYSQCIGQTICIASLALSFVLRKRGVKSKLIYIVGCCIIVPLGFYIGESMAEYLMYRQVSRSFDQHIFSVSLIVTIIVSLFSILFYSTWHHVTTLKLAAVEESARASKARLSMLQAQLEPHMLFNTLSNLRSLIDSNPQTAQHMLDHLVDYLRATLAGSQHDAVSLKQEFDLLEHYLSLMKIRMGRRLTFKLELPDQLQEIPVPVLILQPVVENAIKHGLEPAIDGGNISIRARVDDQLVAVEIKDTGVGYNSVDQILSDGFGLQSVRDRLQTANTDYEVLSISSPPPDCEAGTLITIRLPLSTRHAVSEVKSH